METSQLLRVLLRLCAVATPLWELKHLLQRRMRTWGLIVTVFQGSNTQKIILNDFVHPGVSLYLIRTFQSHSRSTFSPLWVLKGYILLVVAKDVTQDGRGRGYPNFGQSSLKAEKQEEKTQQYVRQREACLLVTSSCHIHLQVATSWWTYLHRRWEQNVTNGIRSSLKNHSSEQGSENTWE